MTKLPQLFIQTCAAAMMISQLFTLVLGLKKTSNVDEVMVENHRTRMRQNYVMQRALNNDMDNGEIGVRYVSEQLDPITNSEVPAFIMDYANMRRNDIILLDNSVETRTSKRGNIKVKKYGIPEVNEAPCSCEENGREPEILGDDYFPTTIENRICNEKRCPSPYGCHRRIHNVTILKRRNYMDSVSEDLPEELQKRWVAVKRPVTVGCMCLGEITYYN